MKVSIIVPVYNAEKTLETCVNSIIEQDYDDIECILVENGSTDGSWRKCNEYALKYKNVLAATIDETSASRARNKGLTLATGEIIGFCDADDFLEPSAISQIVKEFLKDLNVQAVFGVIALGKYCEGKLKKKYLRIRRERISAKYAIRRIIDDNAIMGSACNKYYKKEVVGEQLFDNDLSFCEDMHFNVRILSRMGENKWVQLIDTPIYCYMDNSNSVTHKSELLFTEKDELKYFVAINKICMDCSLDKYTLKFVKKKIACLAIDTIKGFSIDGEKKCKLICILKKNYPYLFLGVSKNNWKNNLMHILFGAIILFCNFRSYQNVEETM